MKSALALLLFILSSWIAVSPARAFDPRITDILLLRLGMTEAQALDRLRAQGWSGPLVKRDTRPCPTDRSRQCVTAIHSRSRDGLVDVTFATGRDGDPVAVRIDYTIDGKSPAEAFAIEQGALTRYGPPILAKPMTWCDRAHGSPTCPPDGARLMLRAGDGVQVLTLQEGAG